MNQTLSEGPAYIHIYRAKKENQQAGTSSVAKPFGH
jgi:hypothetical protein